VKIALSILCENPLRKTGLTSAYHELVARSLKLYADVSWIIFVGPNQEWRVSDPRVQVVRDYPANDQLQQRLIADHWKVPLAAKRLGADVMFTTGFVPLRKTLPTAMHVLSLQHLDVSNKLSWQRRLYRGWIMGQSWPRADLIITNSRFAAAQILGVFPHFRNKLVQAYEGLQHEQFHPRAEPGEQERLRAVAGVASGYFLWLSNFYPYKQGDRLLAAYARLAPELRRQHPLVMVGGEWEGHLAACREQARRLNVANEVKFLGWVSDDLLAPLYRHALAHVLPSREETFGRTVIEAMASGTPVIVNDIPIMHEVTEGHALIVDFHDTPASAMALRRIAEDEAFRMRLREEGLRRAQDFTFEKFTAERIEAIRSVVEGKRPRRLVPEKKLVSLTYSLADQDFERTKSIGIFNVSLQLAEFLAVERGIDRFTVLANRSMAPLLRLPREVTVEMHDEAAGRGLQRVAWDQWRVYSAARRTGNEWLLLPKGFSSFVRRSPVRLAVYVHDVMHNIYGRRYPGRLPWFEQFYFEHSMLATLREADVIFTNTEFTAAEVRRVARESGFREPPVHCAGIGFTSVPSSGGPKENTILVLTSTWPHKRTALALEWMQRWQDETSFSGEVHLVGGLPQEQAAPARANWKQHERIGETEYRALLGRARSLVYFSDYEGFGMPPVEATLAGAAAVYSDLPATRLGMSGAGFSFNNSEYQSFASAMNRALSVTPATVQLWQSELLARHNWQNVARVIVNTLAAME
jgi:O-antigen biosynthesis alpha-1,3-rhamnosyltransferase